VVLVCRHVLMDTSTELATEVLQHEVAGEEVADVRALRRSASFKKLLKLPLWGTGTYLNLWTSQARGGHHKGLTYLPPKNYLIFFRVP